MEPVRKHFRKLRFWVNDAAYCECPLGKCVRYDVEVVCRTRVFLRLDSLELCFHRFAFLLSKSSPLGITPPPPLKKWRIGSTPASNLLGGSVKLSSPFILRMQHIQPFSGFQCPAYRCGTQLSLFYLATTCVPPNLPSVGYKH